MKFSIGADPEIFFAEPSGKLRSVIGLLGGSKSRPFQWGGDGFAYLEDNVAAEFNIPPCTSVQEFSDAIFKSIQQLELKAEQLGMVLSTDIAKEFDDDQLRDPMAFVFGCEPDFNAWTNRINPKPRGSSMALRSVGGHVHIGFDHSKYDRNKVIQACDLYLGVPSVLMDGDTQRRELYGKAGAHRKKPYGAEYRTLSNFWIWKENHHNWVYHQVERALDSVELGQDLSKDAALIQHAINDSDVSAAGKLMDKYF